MTAILELVNVSKSFGGFRALTDVSFSVVAGESHALIGPNGAGKSTLVNVLCGQIAADSGKVLFESRDISGLAAHQIARKGVGRTFQVSRTYRHMSVYENMLSAFIGSGSGRYSLSRSLLDDHRDRVTAALQSVGLETCTHLSVEKLSPGDRKRLEFGMALAGDPKLLVLDEPTAGMGLIERQDLMRMVTQVVKERSVALLFVEHDIDIVFTLADRITVLAQGKVLAAGQPQEIAANKQVQDVYLGRSLH
ncbi:ABC transporter ATP-binding protein [Microvirga sp. G4-2]|uniref:ABC transporter ATP-binding protein n=1 Tax=Microvirga sp. G4-2 TaxID=3434467 RepID=UPI00404421D6